MTKIILSLKNAIFKWNKNTRKGCGFITGGVVKKTPYDTIAISTHTGPMLAILDLAGGTDKRIGNCDYVKLIFDGKKFSK